MPIQPGQGKTAVALLVDGLSIKFVQLSMKGKKVALRDYKTVALVKKFEEKEVTADAEQEATFGEPQAAADAFGAAGGAMEAASDEANTNSTVLLGLLSDLSGGKYTLNYALSEPAVTFQEFDTDFGMKGSKLKKRLLEELASTRSSVPQLDAFEAIPMSQGGLLTVIREDGLHLYDLLTEIRSFLGNKVPNLKLIDSADVALMDIFRAGYDVQDEEVTVIVYVGHDFSRIIFMQGRQYMHFAPIISEGHESPNIENTLYSRILLEQDNIALTRMDRILLAGEAHKVNLLESLGPQFSNSQVEYLTCGDIDVSQFEGSVGESISEYAIPIATAWKALNEKHAGFSPTNLIPNAILEAQKVFKLAWHGWLVALGVIASIVFFSDAIRDRAVEIRRANEELRQKESRMSDLENFRQRKSTLEGDIATLSNATTTYDKIAPGGDRWSRILHYIATSVEDLNSMWIHRIHPDEQNKSVIVITGRSIYRTRIPRIASIFEKAMLREVRTTTMRGKVVYEFDIAVEQVDKNDTPEAVFNSNKR